MDCVCCVLTLIDYHDHHVSIKLWFESFTECLMLCCIIRPLPLNPHNLVKSAATAEQLNLRQTDRRAFPDSIIKVLNRGEDGHTSWLKPKHRLQSSWFSSQRMKGWFQQENDVSIGLISIRVWTLIFRRPASARLEWDGFVMFVHFKEEKWVRRCRTSERRRARNKPQQNETIWVIIENYQH